MGVFLTGDNVMVVDWVLLSTAYLLVLVRLWFRLIFQRMSLTLSDTFLLIATIEVLAIMICFVREHQLGAMRQVKPKDLSPAVKKLSLATILLYDTSLYFLKFSILSFYYHLFPISAVRLRRALMVVSGYTAACFFTAFFMAVFWCGTDISRNWSPRDNCSVWDGRLFKADWGLNITSDILILVLPFPLLYKLQLATRQIVALCITFGLGVITIVVSVGRFVAFMSAEFVPLYVWSMAEICTGIVVVSLPALRPLLRKASHRISSPTHSGDTFGPSDDVSPSKGVLSKAWNGTRDASKSASQPPRRWPGLSGSGTPYLKSRKDVKSPLGYHYRNRRDEMGSNVELHSVAVKRDAISRTEEIIVYSDSKGVDKSDVEAQKQVKGKVNRTSRLWEIPEGREGTFGFRDVKIWAEHKR